MELGTPPPFLFLPSLLLLLLLALLRSTAHTMDNALLLLRSVTVTNPTKLGVLFFLLLLLLEGVDTRIAFVVGVIAKAMLALPEIFDCCKR